jgi:hypothetical protein
LSMLFFATCRHGFTPKMPHDWVYLGDLYLFPFVLHRLPPDPTTATFKLASDWLSVGLELRSFCYWTST